MALLCNAHEILSLIGIKVDSFIIAGSPSITSVVFDRNLTTLTCTSTGGPPTTVTWRKNNVPVNLSLYEQSQRLIDAERATYINGLFNANVANFVGSFTCEVSNVIGSVEETVVLNGKNSLIIIIKCW